MSYCQKHTCIETQKRANTDHKLLSCSARRAVNEAGSNRPHISSLSQGFPEPNSQDVSTPGQLEAGTAAAHCHATHGSQAAAAVVCGALMRPLHICALLCALTALPGCQVPAPVQYLPSC